MAWFVFGRRRSVKATPDGVQIRARCPECAREASFSPCEATTSYTAFFVVPLWTHATPCHRCNQCGAEVELAESPSPTDTGAGAAEDPVRARMRAEVEARVEAKRQARRRAARVRASGGANDDSPESPPIPTPAGARDPAAAGADASKAAQIEAELEALKRKVARSRR